MPLLTLTPQDTVQSQSRLSDICHYRSVPLIPCVACKAFQHRRAFQLVRRQSRLARTSARHGDDADPARKARETAEVSFHTVVRTRCPASYAHRRKMQQDLFTVEQKIYIFQLEILGFRVEEVDHRYETSVEDAKVYVSPVSDSLDRDGRDLDDEKCELRMMNLDDQLRYERESPRLDILTIQLDAEAKAAAGARIGSGAYSDGRSQGIAKRPMAKKKLDRSRFSTMIHLIVSCFSRSSTHLKRNNIVAATIPVALYVTEVVPASTAIQQH